MPNNEPFVVRVKVRAGARKEAIIEKRPGSFEISVKEPAEGNRANARVREIIARRMHVSTKEVRIVTGHRSPTKTLRIVR